MEAFNLYVQKLMEWIEATALYKEFLKEMPSPFNNLYFDAALVMCIGLYVIYRVISGIRIYIYRKRIKKEQRLERNRILERQKSENEELENEKQILRDKEDKVNRFLDYMEFVFSGRYRDNYANYSKDDVYDEDYPAKRVEKKNRRIGSRFAGFLSVGESEKTKSAYEESLSSYERNRERDATLRKQMDDEQGKVKDKMSSLDAELIIDVTDSATEKSNEVRVNPDFERRKKAALKRLEKERKLAEKKERKEAKQHERAERKRKK